MTSDSIGPFLDDLSNDFNNLTAAHTFCIAGLTLIPDHLAKVPKFPNNPDPIIQIAAGDPGPETPAYAGWKMSEALEQVKKDGPIETRLGHLWLTSFYALWDEQYRPRHAALHGRSLKEEKYDLFGDLRRLRNDAVHHRGIASSGETGNCVLLKHWFQPGEMILLRGTHFAEFFRLIPWSDLATGSNTRTSNEA